MTKNQFADQKRRDSGAYTLAQPALPIKTIAPNLGIGYSTQENEVVHPTASRSIGAIIDRPIELNHFWIA